VKSSPFEQFAARMRSDVNAYLAGWLQARVAAAVERGGDVGAIAAAVSQLVLRGGKRLRAILLSASYQACGGDGAASVPVAAGASLELLQGYLLVHDDWMDGDEVRRGAPSVPALMRDRFAARGDAAAILAGDLACAWAQACLLDAGAGDAALPAERLVRATRELAIAQEDVIAGQMLDIAGRAGDAPTLEAVHALKTASYTVRAPVVMGACLAGAHDSQVASLAAFARPLGVAFQLRDDVLGVFGDPRVTGKPRGSDLRQGKRTAVVIEALHDESAREVLDRVLGRVDAEEEDVRRAALCIEKCGARERVERRIRTLVENAREALGRAELAAAGRDILASACGAMTDRDG
jgi:geranylgeranyl diphosphate synthase type I